MTVLTSTEENYLKTIYGLSNETDTKIANLSIAEKLNINPATVTEMLRRLNEKKYIDYNRVDGATLTESGRLLALQIIRNHRLWETFLEKKLGFTWVEVHEIAEQLEHVRSQKLIEKLDNFLGHPKFDPHGDPIPDAEGKLPKTNSIPLSEIAGPGKFKITGVSNESTLFLKFLDKLQLNIGDLLEVKEIQDFDNSMFVVLNNSKNTMFSNEVAKHLNVEIANTITE